jgi:transposase InsO family protein
MPGSRRPRSSPARTDPLALQIALKTRQWLREQGLDHGPLSVSDRMERDGLQPPSRATLARAFLTAGDVRPEPRKRPRAANRRFVYPCPNACWQIDATDWSLADGRRCVIFQVIDDHSRLALASRAAWGETSDDAIAVIDTAIKRWGIPVKLLSDNGRALNPSRLGQTGRLVEHLRAMGVTPITGKPYKPTTQGKNERFHQTLHKWLNARPPARSLTRLQALIDEHDEYYNTQRAHQALPGRMTPSQAWDATLPADPPTPPDGPALPTAPSAATSDETMIKTVQANGHVTWRSCELYLGKNHIGTSVYLIWNATTITITKPDQTPIYRYPRPAPGRRRLGARDRLPDPEEPQPCTMS